MRSNIYRYIVIASMTLIGMSLSLYADLRIGQYLHGGMLDAIVRQITLLLAFDIVVRESLRFSLLKEFSSAENNTAREQKYSTFLLILVLGGILVSFLYACVYTYLLKDIYRASLWLPMVLFSLMFLSAGLQLILNLTGRYFFYSLRIFLLPLSILIWVMVFNRIPFEYSVLMVFVAYVAIIALVLRKILFHLSIRKGAMRHWKKYVVPPLFPMTSYGFLQTSRYLERSLVASVSVGSSYFIYFSFRLYSAFLSLIGLPVSVLLAKSLVDNDSLDEEKNRWQLRRVAAVIVILWTLGIGTLFLFWLSGYVAQWFPKLSEHEFLNVVGFYLLAALLGSLNLPLQATIYRRGGHALLTKMTISMNMIYIAIIVVGAQMMVSSSMSWFVGLAFLSYVILEFAIYVFLLRLLNQGKLAFNYIE